MYIVLDRRGADAVAATEIDDRGDTVGEHAMPDVELPEFIARREGAHPRWVWDSTAKWYPTALSAGVRIDRCIDLALSHAILRTSALTAASDLARTDDGRWSALEPAVQDPVLGPQVDPFAGSRL